MEQVGILKGNHLYLRDQTLEDAEKACSFNADLELLGLDPPVEERSQATFYSVVTINEVHIGSMSAYNYIGSKVELGIRIWNRDYWNKGYGTEAVSLLCDWIFSHTDVVVVELKTHYSNVRAKKCYEKCGFKEYRREVIGGYNMIRMVKSKEVST